MDQNTQKSKELVNHLLDSVKNKDFDKVEELLAEGVDVNAEGKLEEFHVCISPLSLAAEKGHVEIVKALLQSSDIDVNQKDYNNETALHRAAANGHLEVVENMLATKKVDINVILAKGGDTALHLASYRGHVEVVEELLKYPGILVNIKDDVGKNPLHGSASRGHLEVVDMLLNVPGILVNEKDYLHDHTPLHLAAEFRHADVVEALLSHPDTDVNVKDKYLQTPLHTPAYHGDLKIVELLLQGGISAKEKDKDGQTPIYWASKQRHSQVVKMIVDHLKEEEVRGVDVNARRKQVEYLAQRRIERGNISKLNKYTERKGNDPNNQLLLAAKNNDLEKVEVLLNQPDIDVNSVDRNGNTPLHLASEKGYVQLVKVLVGVKGINVNAKNIDRSKLFYPIHPGDHPNRGKLNYGKTPLYLAVEKRLVDVVRVLLDHPDIDVNAKDKYSIFPLWLAVKNDDNKIVEALLGHSSIDVNATYICNDHFTSLHHAVEKGNLLIINMLLSHPNIDVNVQDKFYRGTALHFAVTRKNMEIVKAILNHHGIDINVKNMFSSNNVKFMRQFTVM